MNRFFTSKLEAEVKQQQGIADEIMEIVDEYCSECVLAKGS